MFGENVRMRFLQLGQHISSAKVRLRLKKKEQELRVAGLIAGYARSLCSELITFLHSVAPVGGLSFSIRRRRQEDYPSVFGGTVTRINLLH